MPPDPTGFLDQRKCLSSDLITRNNFQQHASSKTTWLFSEFPTSRCFFLHHFVHHEDPCHKPRHWSTSTPSKTPMGKQRWKVWTCLSRNGFALYNRKDKPFPPPRWSKWRGVSSLRTVKLRQKEDKKTHRKKLSFWVLSFECFLPRPQKTRPQKHASSLFESEYVHAMI